MTSSDTYRIGFSFRHPHHTLYGQAVETPAGYHIASSNIYRDDRSEFTEEDKTYLTLLGFDLWIALYWFTNPSYE